MLLSIQKVNLATLHTHLCIYNTQLHLCKCLTYSMEIVELYSLAMEVVSSCILSLLSNFCLLEKVAVRQTMKNIYRTEIE